MYTALCWLGRFELIGGVLWLVLALFGGSRPGTACDYIASSINRQICERAAVEARLTTLIVPAAIAFSCVAAALLTFAIARLIRQSDENQRALAELQRGLTSNDAMPTN